jgi:SGNH hydrolase-like domain, acetyltransferase AlgX
MAGNDRSMRGRLGRVTEYFALGVAIVASFCVGYFFDHRQPNASTTPPPVTSPPPRLPLTVYSFEKTSPIRPNEMSRSAERLTREEQSSVARAARIRGDIEMIENECRLAAGGDWDRWDHETVDYRKALGAKIDVLKHVDSVSPIDQLCQFEPLQGRNGFPLFEVCAKYQIQHLFDPTAWAGFRRERAVVAAHRWLRNRGIDLIFAPVPKMSEVYVEHFLDRCPADGIIAPYVRRTILELLKADVEVIDLFPRFRTLREPDPDYLFNSADTHWAPRGMRITAKEVADRIERYRFGSSARYALPIVKTALAPFQITPAFVRDGRAQEQNGWKALTVEQRKIAESVQPANINRVLTLDDRTPPDDPQSPVMIIGNSYVLNFREQLIRELNLLVSTLAYNDQTTQAFGEFLRDPDLLGHTRVVVWITSEAHLMQFQAMPPEILDTLAREQ